MTLSEISAYEEAKEPQCVGEFYWVLPWLVVIPGECWMVGVNGQNWAVTWDYLKDRTLLAALDEAELPLVKGTPTDAEVNEWAGRQGFCAGKIIEYVARHRESP